MFLTRRTFLAGAMAAPGRAFHRAELIFPQEKWHNHSSCIVELPGGQLFVCWYHGSGERTADDVVVEGARLSPGAEAWSPRFLLADTPGFPDCNPALFVDSRRRLWLIWPAILANEWHTALLKYRISSDYRRPGPPRWDLADNLLFVPRNFALAKHPRAGDKYFSRLGWMPRAHPIELPSGRIIVPLYSDGYDFSLMALTDDGGRTWTTSDPLPGPGNVQPTIARKTDGTLVAYMRDNGPPPKRVQLSESRDDGLTWSPVQDTTLPNPGSGLEVINLRDGRWCLIYNDTERGRHSLAVAISEDHGGSWKWKRHLESATGSFHYPSLIQAADGSLHASYSYFTAEGKSIKHAHFSPAWVEQGD